MVIFKVLKKLLGKKYEIKDLREVKTIIGWQITRDPIVRTIKINQSAFIRDFVIEKKLIDCNANVIPMKVGSAIKMNDSEDYKETKL